MTYFSIWTSADGNPVKFPQKLSQLELGIELEKQNLESFACIAITPNINAHTAECIACDLMTKNELKYFNKLNSFLNTQVRWAFVIYVTNVFNQSWKLSYCVEIAVLQIL